jgi:hypothetical protein
MAALACQGLLACAAWAGLPSTSPGATPAPTPAPESVFAHTVSAVIFLLVFVAIALANLAVFRGGMRRGRNITTSGLIGFEGFGGGFGGFGTDGCAAASERPTSGLSRYLGTWTSRA